MKCSLFKFCFIILLSCYLSAVAVNPVLLCDIPFLKIWGSSNDDNTCFDLVEDADGDFWISGNFNDRAILLQSDIDGNLLKQIGLNGTSGDDFTRSLLLDSDNNILTAGRDQPNSPTENYYFKINPNIEEIIWARQFPFPAYTRLEKVVEIAPNGNYIYGGLIDGAGADAFLMEVDRNTGDPVWQKTYHLGTTDLFLTLKIIGGSLYAGGVVRDGGLDKIRPFLMKADLQGNVEWSKIYLKSFNENARLYLEDILVENSRLVLAIRGSYATDSFGDSRAFIVTIDYDGEVLNSYQYGINGENPTAGNYLKPLGNGEYLLSGFHGTDPNDNSFFIRLNGDFEPQLSKSVDIKNNARLPFVVKGDDVFFCVQSAVVSGNGNRDILFGKVDMFNPTGADECSYFYDQVIDFENLNNTFSQDVNVQVTNQNYDAPSFTLPTNELNLPTDDLCECFELEEEICDNGIDDDGDGLVDCEDPDIQDECCCYEPPVLELGDDIIACEGETILLDAGQDFVTYNWQDGTADQQYVVGQSGNYSVTVTDQCGSTQSDMATVTVFSNQATFDTVSICDGEDVLIFGSLQSQSGNYFANFTDENGCDSLHQITLVVFEDPMTSENLFLCNGDTATIFGNTQTTAGTYTATFIDQNGCDSTHTIELSFADTLFGFTNLFICPGDSILILGNYESDPGEFSESLISTGGCDSIHTYILEWTPSLIVDFDVANACEDATNGSAQAIVSGGIPPYQYLWEDGSTSDTLQNIAAGLYAITVEDDFGCQAVASAEVNNFDDPSVILVTTDETCVGFNDGTIAIVNFDTLNTYVLNGDTLSTDSLFVDLVPGSDSISLWTVNDCSFSIPFQVLPADSLYIGLPRDTSICLGASINLPVSTFNFIPFGFQWNPNPTLSCMDCEEPSATPIDENTYFVQVFDENGCVVSDSVSIGVTFTPRVFFPNVFSPNNDGTNDYFFPIGDKSVRSVVDFKVFGRWGQLVYEQENFPINQSSYGWDGTFRGAFVNPDVYVWLAKIEFLNGEVFQYEGDVTVLR